MKHANAMILLANEIRQWRFAGV